VNGEVTKGWESIAEIKLAMSPSNKFKEVF